jgi:hypothetical protein
MSSWFRAGIGRQLFPDLDLFGVAMPILERSRAEYQQAAAGVATEVVWRRGMQLLGLA